MSRSHLRLFTALLLWLAALACWRPYATPDEGRYTDVARWMLRSGDWVVPRLDGLPFLHKPPLYYWIEALGLALLGTHPLAARLASLAGACLIAWAAHALVRRWLDDAAGARWTVLLLATNPLFVLGSQYANLDMLVASCITGTITLAVLATRADPQLRRWLWWGAHVAAGLGVLAKGLIGVVLPGGVFVLWCLLDRQPRRLLDAISPVGLLLLALVVLPWFVLMERQVPDFMHFFFVVQHFERFTEAGFNNAFGPWFFPAIVAVGMLPWSPLIWPAVRHGLRGVPAQQRSLAWLGIAWFLVVMVFFSMPRSKLAGYILPLTPAVAILLGPWVARWRYRVPVALLGAALCVGLVAYASVKQNDDAATLARALKARIADADAVVFWDRYDYAVPVTLDRAPAAQVIGTWDKSSRELPDNWRRELVEGREFQPRLASPLLSRAQWVAALKAHPGRVHWVWADAKVAAEDPLTKGWPVVQRAGHIVVLRVVAP